MKKVITAVLFITIAMFMFSCGKSSDSSTSESTPNVTYQDILDEYTAKLKDATPKLIDEYKTEAKGITDGAKLTEIGNAKVDKLATIGAEGIEKMSEIMHANGDDLSVLEEWSYKITAVYNEQEKLITDSYMEDAF